MKKKMLITGVSGLLGSNLAHYHRETYDVLGTYKTHKVDFKGIKCQSINLSESEPISKLAGKFKPDCFIHCAALTNIEYCEDHEEQTYQDNVVATKNVVQACRTHKVKLLHISTDNLFDGKKDSYTEADKSSPINIYALSKAKAEEEALTLEGALVARTNIFGWNAQEKCSLAEWVIMELTAGKTINGFTDAYFSSIYTMKLAKLFEDAINQDLSGIYNFVSSTSMSKYEFLKKIAECFSLDTSLINPISVDDFSFKAKRGKNLVLEVVKLKEALQCAIPTIEESIEAFYADSLIKLPKEIRTTMVTA